jgi:hypothetical protein
VVQVSTWILLFRNPQIFEHPIILAVKPRPLDGREVLFTDRYSNLFRVLKWDGGRWDGGTVDGGAVGR